VNKISEKMSEEGTNSDRRKSLVKQNSKTNLAPGEVPQDPVVIRQRDATTNSNVPEQFIFTEMRMKTRGNKKPKKKGMGSKAWSAFWCLVPDVVEHGASYAGKEVLKGAVDVAAILQAVATLDPRRVRDEIRAIIKNSLFSDLSKYEYNNDTGKLPGRLTAREMIYCARLSLLAYLTRDVSYDQFFPDYRENEILQPAFDDGAEANEVHRFFMVKYVSSLFENEKLDASGAENQRFGYAKGIANGLADMNLELVYPFDVNNNEGYIAKSKNFEKAGGDVVIAFQGTVDRADFVTNFKGSLTPFEPLWDRTDAGSCSCLQGTMFGCCLNEPAAQKQARKNNKPVGRVHLGFYEAFLSVRPIIQATLEQLFAKVVPDKLPVRIVVTGHSLGGALATLCVAWLMQWFRNGFPGGLPEGFRLLSITFGQPKVGDDDFCHALDDDEWTNWSETQNAKFKTYRIFTPSDPVVCTPPVSLGFRHCYAMCLIRSGHLFFLPQTMAKDVDTTSDGFRRAIDHGLAVLHFHDLFNYLNAVMHFADLTRGDLDMEQVFGSVDYEADVRDPGFFKKF